MDDFLYFSLSFPRYPGKELFNIKQHTSCQMRYHGWMPLDCGVAETCGWDNGVNIFSSRSCHIAQPAITGDVRGNEIQCHVKKLQRFPKS
jgi:hypothetical protein